MKCLPLILSGPSGVGKNYVLKHLLLRLPLAQETVSFTTRQPRPGERDGKQYNFIKHDQFNRKIEKGQFLEWAQVHSHFYGTCKLNLKKIQNNGKIPMLVIDINGAKQAFDHIQCLAVFLLPPNQEVWKSRLDTRGTESSEHIEKRMRRGREEIREANQLAAYKKLVQYEGSLSALQIHNMYLKAQGLKPLLAEKYE